MRGLSSPVPATGRPAVVASLVRPSVAAGNRSGDALVSRRWVRLVHRARRRAGATAQRVPGLRRRWEQRPDPAEPLVKAISAELATGELDRGHQLAEHGSRSRPDHIQLQDLLIASLDHRDEFEQALELCVENAARRIRWLDRRRVTARYPRRLDQSQRIFLAGYFRSGSSAVLDYLRGGAGVTNWTPAGEMRLLKAPGGVADLVARCQTQGGLTDRDLVDFYLHLTGWKLTRHPPGTFHARDVVNRNSAALFRIRRAYGYLRTCLECFLELADLTASTRPTVADLEVFFRDAVGRALDAAAADAAAEVVLVDQAINAWRLPLSRFLPPSTFVIVHRDPRDQYVDVRQVQQKPGRTPTTAERFTHDYRRNRTRADRDIPRIAHRYGHRCVRLSFEDFVLDHQRQAHQLLASLALPRPLRGRGHYLPRQGRDGIGQHIAMLSPSELATLTESLPEYLDHRIAAR